MQIILVALGSIGDLMPFLAVAERLRARGHRCIFASNAGYAQLVQASGFQFATVWERSAESLDDILTKDSERAWAQVRAHMFEPATEPVFRCISHVRRSGPTIVLASWSAFGARKAYAQFGIPLISTYLSPHALTLPDAADDPGLKLGLFPDWFAPEVKDLRLTGFAIPYDAEIAMLPPALEDFLREGPPPIVFTPGSFMRQCASFFKAGLCACEQLGHRAILLSPYADQVPTLPPFARYYPYIALQRLAPRAAALVHHGGIGTAAQALRAGLPQLVAPVFFDQFDNAARLEVLGVGRRLAKADNSALMALHLAAILQEAVRQRADKLRTRFAHVDPAMRVCEVVESLS